MSSARDPSPSRPSLLIPTNPAFITNADLVPRGGILLNRMDSTQPGAPDEQSPRRFSDPASPATSLSTLGPASPVDEKASGLAAGADRKHPGLAIVAPPSDPALAFVAGAAGSPLASPGGTRPKIRFAPLPDPRRPRSLSTGRNLGFRASLEPGGARQVAWELRGVDGTGYGSEEAVDDGSSDEGGADEAGDGDDEGEGGRRGLRWVMGVPVPGWKGTRKLLGGKTKEAEYELGGPLKKSVSTGGLMGTSPFRSNHELERKSLFQGLSPPTSTTPRRTSSTSASTSASPAHRRNSSLDVAGSPALLASSAPVTPVKMLNGRVYGSRRASEAAEAAEEERRRHARDEPAFVEWGYGARAGMGSVSRAAATEDDDDDGGGMAWVRKRREERERRASERRESEEREARAAQPHAHAQASGRLVPAAETTDAAPLTPAPAPPTFGASFGAAVAAAHADAIDREPSPKSAPPAPSPSASPASSPESLRNPLTPAPIGTALPEIHVSESSPTTAHGPGFAPLAVPAPVIAHSTAIPRATDKVTEKDRAHVVRTVQVPSALRAAKVEDEIEGDDDGEEDEDDDEDVQDNDDGDDDDELELEGVSRSTASAAGVEVVSRHK
ncbi:hypothetical protein Q5752_001283 [Cryptotrichosporon argae]